MPHHTNTTLSSSRIVQSDFLLKKALRCPHRRAASHRPEIRVAIAERPGAVLDDDGVDHGTPLAARSGVGGTMVSTSPVATS